MNKIKKCLEMVGEDNLELISIASTLKMFSENSNNDKVKKILDRSYRLLKIEFNISLGEK